MNDGITIRRAETIADYHACQEAQRLAWGITDDSYIVPVATMVGAQLHGGLVLGAFLPDGEAAGLSFAFLGKLEGKICLYSQLTGVAPGFQGQGIGYKLKRVQWDYACSEGLALLAWAFDPLQEGNAHFNLERLGATCGRFIENMYGLRTDSLNEGAPTDRLIAEWSTTETARRSVDPGTAASLPRLLDRGLHGMDESLAISVEPQVLLEIPDDIQHIRKSERPVADAWARSVRTAFTRAFARGYRATGFVRIPDGASRRSFYLLERSSGDPAGTG